jgi:hypothetical protein
VLKTSRLSVSSKVKSCSLARRAALLVCVIFIPAGEEAWRREEASTEKGINTTTKSIYARLNYMLQQQKRSIYAFSSRFLFYFCIS